MSYSGDRFRERMWDRLNGDAHNPYRFDRHHQEDMKSEVKGGIMPITLAKPVLAYECPHCEMSTILDGEGYQECPNCCEDVFVTKSVLNFK